MAQAADVGKLVLRATGAPPLRLVDGDATYWITGAGGALGVRTARWLGASGARQLLSRGGTNLRQKPQSLIEECRALGAARQFRVADAGDADAMRAVHGELRAAWPG